MKNPNRIEPLFRELWEEGARDTLVGLRSVCLSNPRIANGICFGPRELRPAEVVAKSEQLAGRWASAARVITDGLRLESKRRHDCGDPAEQEPLWILDSIAAACAREVKRLLYGNPEKRPELEH